MPDSFPVEIITPVKLLFSGAAEEVVLPAHDGQVGVLADHCDFIGRLGTGSVRVSGHGKEMWFAVSAGGFHIEDGTLTVVTAIGEGDDGVDEEAANTRLNELQKELDAANRAVDNVNRLERYRDYEKAKLEILKHGGN